MKWYYGDYEVFTVYVLRMNLNVSMVTIVNTSHSEANNNKVTIDEYPG